MVEVEQWEFRSDWLDWARSVWEPDRGRVQLQHPPREGAHADFAKAATGAFRARSVPVVNLKVWASVQQPEQGEGFAAGYPHVHHPLDAMTLVHYLDPSDVDAPLEVLDGDRVIQTVSPKPGLTVFFWNHVMHGVRKYNGARDRVQLIATALPR